METDISTIQNINSKGIFGMNIFDCALAVVFGIITGVTAYSIEGATVFTCISLSILTIFCIALVLRSIKPSDTMIILMLCAFAAAAMFIRGCMFFYVSTDYTNFLAKWLVEMRELGGVAPLVEKIGDYNMPYLYFLFILSKLPVEFELPLIKTFSIGFDIMCAYYVMKLAALKTENPHIKALAFFGTLFIPTVVLNGSYWGQCDSIYAAFVLASLYYAISGKSKLSVGMVAAAISIKLQTIFFVPAFAVLILARKVKIRDLWLFPSVFAALLIPAIICGRPLIDTVSIYFNQASQYPQLTLNAPSLYALAGAGVSFVHFDKAAIFLAASGLGALFYFCYIRIKSIQNFTKPEGTESNFKGLPISPASFINIAFAFALITPFLLPRMHDRYFFLADILAFAVFLYNKKRWYVPLICILASYNSYHYFVMGAEYLIELKYLALAYVFVIFVIIKDLYEELRIPEKIPENSEISS